MSSRIYTSPYPPLSLVSRSIFTDLLSESVNPKNGNLVGGFSAQRRAFIDATTGTSLNRRELRNLALALGFGLKHDSRIKAKRGDTILIFSPNSLAYPVILLGAIAAGLRCTLANNMYTARELQHQYCDSGATFVLATPDNAAVALEMFKGLGLTQADAEKRVILLTKSLAWAGGPSTSENTNGLVTFEQLLSLGVLQEEERFDGQAAQETVLLCYSSGTSGQPKGVETTHHNLTSEMRAMNPVGGYSHDEQLLMLLPFFHIYGTMAGMFMALFGGAPTIVMTGFDPVEFCIAVEKYHITYVLVVPPVMLAIVRHPVFDNYDLSSLRVLFSSAAPLPSTLIKESIKRLTAKRKPEQVLYIAQGYGMTECSPASHMLPLDKSQSKVGSVGLLLSSYQARLVADDSNDNAIIDAEEGEPGELWVKGPTVMKGYLNNPEANSRSFTPDRWFKTGDICTRDKDGFYYVVDRKKELIKYKGFQGMYR
jgi:4-coumarate--CoA ligase